MGRGAAEGQPEVMRRGDRGDHAERLARALEHDPLLDVQLDQRVDARWIECGVRKPVGVEAGVAQRRGHADPVAVDQGVEVRAVERAGRRAAADATRPEAGLLPRPRDDLDRPPRDEAVGAQRVDRVDRPEHAQHAVEAAGIQSGVDVRARQHQRRVLRPRPAAEQVADGVQARLEAGVAHPLRDPLERRAVGRRVDLARDPARLRVVVEGGQLLDRGVQAAHAPGG